MCESNISFPMVRTDGRAQGHVITKFSRMGRLPHFLSYQAPCTRALRARLELRYKCRRNFAHFSLGVFYYVNRFIINHRLILAYFTGYFTLATWWQRGGHISDETPPLVSIFSLRFFHRKKKSTKLACFS